MSLLTSPYLSVRIFACINWRATERIFMKSIYIKAKPADFVCVFVCVLLGDGSGGVFFLVSSMSVSYW
jgi:hypothetical protein